MQKLFALPTIVAALVCCLATSAFAITVVEEGTLSRDVPQFFGPDNSLVSENEGRVKIWDARSFKIARTFDIRKLDPKDSGVTHLKRDVALSPDGKTLVAATGLRVTNDNLSLVADEARQPEGSLELWDVRSGKKLRTLKHPKSSAKDNFAGPIWFSPDGRIFAIRHYYELWLWETATGKFLRALPKVYYTSRLFFSPDGARILVGSAFLLDEQQDRAVSEWSLWDWRKGRLLRNLQTKDNTDFWGFSLDGKTLRGRIYKDLSKGINALWSTRTGKLVLKAHQKSEPDDLPSPSGGTFLRLKEKSAALYSGRNGKLLHTLNHRSNFPANSQWSYSPDGKTLMERFAWQTWQYPSVMLWDVATGQLKKSWLQPDSESRILSLSPDGSSLFTLGRGAIAERDTQTGETLRTFLLQAKAPNGEEYRYTAISPRGDFLVSLLSGDPTAQVWSTSDSAVRTTLPPPKIAMQEPFSFGIYDVTAAVFSPDETRPALIATGDTVGQVLLWSPQGTLVRRLPIGKLNLNFSVKVLEFSSDGALIAAPVTKLGKGADVLSRITVWKTGTGKIYRDLMDNSASGEEYATFRFSKDSKVLWALEKTTSHDLEEHSDWKIRRWRLEGDNPAPTTVKLTEPVMIKRDDFVGAKFSPDGSVLAIGIMERHYPKASQGRIDCFDTLTGKRIGSLQNAAGVFVSFAWGENGLIVTADENGEIKRWRIEDKT